MARYKKIELQSTLKPSEVIQKLGEIISPLNSRTIAPYHFISYWGNAMNGKYYGTINGTEFEMQKDIPYPNNYRRPFFPRIKGTISPSESGSLIVLEHEKLPISLIIFLLITGGAALGGFIAAIAAAVVSSQFLAALLISAFFISMCLYLREWTFREMRMIPKFFEGLLSASIKPIS